MDQGHSSVHTLSTLPCTERMVCHFMLNANEKHFQGYQAFSAGVLRHEVTFNLELHRGSIYTQSAEQALSWGLVGKASTNCMCKNLCALSGPRPHPVRAVVPVCRPAAELQYWFLSPEVRKCFAAITHESSQHLEVAEVCVTQSISPQRFFKIIWQIQLTLMPLLILLLVITESE